MTLAMLVRVYAQKISNTRNNEVKNDHRSKFSNLSNWKEDMNGRYELNKLTSLPMCGFIAQLVEHRTGIRGGHGFESR